MVPLAVVPAEVGEEVFPPVEPEVLPPALAEVGEVVLPVEPPVLPPAAVVEVGAVVLPELTPPIAAVGSTLGVALGLVEAEGEFTTAPCDLGPALWMLVITRGWLAGAAAAFTEPSFAGEAEVVSAGAATFGSVAWVVPASAGAASLRFTAGVDVAGAEGLRKAKAETKLDTAIAALPSFPTKSLFWLSYS